MPMLRINGLIKAPQEDVYEYVTAYGAGGVITANDFEKKHGAIQRQEGSTFFTLENNDAYSDAPAIEWKCSFEYPNMRVMEALNSAWADRKDTFKTATEGTMWTVEWKTKIGGLRGLAQVLFFRVRGSKSYFNSVVKPVLEHFKG